jgi:hypothetical protein
MTGKILDPDKTRIMTEEGMVHTWVTAMPVEASAVDESVVFVSPFALESDGSIMTVPDPQESITLANRANLDKGRGPINSYEVIAVMRPRLQRNTTRKEWNVRFQVIDTQILNFHLVMSPVSAQ